ncbi:MAG: 7-carboxy-7-deazaguanine synthase QueE [Alphaproteobacteria bacterium]|nr:7-carboxy-7-deazaguanine synthase QueE [Alphaproteobacteria bacterium]
MSDIRVSEIFGPTIQGEGALIGQPTVFVRTGGCDYRCSWCDTLHAVDSAFRHEWAPMSAEEIMAEVERLSGGKPLMVSLSGGNPAIQPLGELIKLGKSRAYRFALETQGSIVQDWFSDLDILTLSPKPPSSGMNTDWGKLGDCIPKNNTTQTVLKCVTFDESDYIYARDVARRFPEIPFYIQPGNHQREGEADNTGLMERLRWLVEKVAADRWYDVTVLPQLHVMIWGNKKESEDD